MSARVYADSGVFHTRGWYAIIRITSKDNSHIKVVQSLLSSRKEREDTGLFVVEGLRLTKAALQHGVAVQTLFCTDSFMQKHPQDAISFEQIAEQSFSVPDYLADKLSDTKTPQGVFAVCKRPSIAQNTTASGKHLILVSLQDSGNLGTIIRTAQALGINSVTLSHDCPDIYAPKVIRATMGGVFAQNLFITHDIGATIQNFKAQGTPVYAAALTANAQQINNINFSGSCAVVIGNEGNGLPQEIIDLATGAVMIPMQGSDISLNAAVAASLFMWELIQAN